MHKEPSGFEEDYPPTGDAGFGVDDIDPDWKRDMDFHDEVANETRQT